MAITTYAELLTAVAAWLGRPGDSVITDNDDDFVTLAETRIYYGAGDMGDPFYSPPVRSRQMETDADISFTTQTSALPTGWLGARRVYLDSSPVIILNELSSTDFWARFLSSTTGQPNAYTIEGDNMVIGPSPDATYTVKALCWKKFSALSSAVNALFTASPNLWLYGSLLEAAIFTDDPQGAQRFHSLYQAAAKGLMRSDQLDRFGGAPLQVRADINPLPRISTVRGA